jgi:hypothetical protein
MPSQPPDDEVAARAMEGNAAAAQAREATTLLQSSENNTSLRAISMTDVKQQKKPNDSYLPRTQQRTTHAQPKSLTHSRD